MNLVRAARTNSRAVFLVTAALTVAGLVALFQLPSNIYPELNFPRVVVLVHTGDLSPDTMLLTVTRPIEEQVSTVLGVRRVRSRTIRGAAEISVFFTDDMSAASRAARRPVPGRAAPWQGRFRTRHKIVSEAVRRSTSLHMALRITANLPACKDDLKSVLHAEYSRKT